MASDGIYVSSLPSADRFAAVFLLPFYSKRRVGIVRVRPSGEDLDQLRTLCEAGKLRPVIDRVFRLEELAAAHAYNQRGSTAGKIVISLPFLDTYRTMCLAPQPVFRRMLQDLRDLRSCA